MNLEHPLRPHEQPHQAVWDAAAGVPDPEIPVISIADLGILRSARCVEGQAHVVITPTYSGCPAMDHITADLKTALTKAGFERPKIETVLQPAWSTDWMTTFGKERLAAYGIAPPQRSATRNTGPILLDLKPPPPVDCPHCGSTQTRKLAQFGSTSCKALYQCQDCLEPFDYFKVH
ncbi:phenylacetic acid degradation protein [Corynebacterium phocae]|uniref:Phenylacetic acid degradation protein n=1 Tax=Corynebacterium phocae TaxID=161895 RepID=A0A1L7D6P0_9CORY|nr:phenylacetic acid degradation protein [Corynebacterium phocae]